MKLLKNKKLMIPVYVICILVLTWVVFAVIPPSKVIGENPFIVGKGERPLIAAHRGGKNLRPENTMLAFNYAIDNYSIDILELDLVMTKDGHLVSIHDDTINASSDAEEVLDRIGEDLFVGDFTLEELLQFNFGAKFKDRDGNYPYANLVNLETENRAEVIRTAQLNIVTIEEILDAYYDIDLMFIIEIKNAGEKGKAAADILYSLMTDDVRYPNSNFLRRIVIGTFHNEIELYIRNEYPSIFRGASVGEAAKFLISQMVGVNVFVESSFVCLQIPTSYNIKGIKLNLAKKTYINRAHRKNISVQYWTINDRDTMIKLINYGADVIMTDDPDVLYQVLIDLGYKFN